MRLEPLLKLIRTRRRVVIISGILTALSAACGLVLWAGSEIASPPRRALMDHHREFLSNPAAHGVRLDRFTTSDGTPCLICSPDSAGVLDKRGQIIRQQVSARGLTLPPAGKITGILVLCHGRKGRKEDYLPIAERLCAVGFRCIIPDLPAHGDNPATIATYGIREAELPARILDEASRRFAFEKQPAGLLGMSMGGSVAIHAGARPDAPWRALAVVSSFDSFPAAIASQASLHAGPLLGPPWANAAAIVYQWKSGIPLDSIRPCRHAASIRIPTLIAHGMDDRVIPLASGRRLFKSLPATTLKHWQEIPGANHDNVLVTAYPIYADIAEWMIRHVTTSQAAVVEPEK